jgi:hypothetical protein
MEIGIDSFAAILPDPATGRPPSATDRMADLLHEVEIGGVGRITLQMSTASLDTAAMTRSIELLGTEVAPIVRAAHAPR